MKISLPCSSGLLADAQAGNISKPQTSRCRGLLGFAALLSFFWISQPIMAAGSEELTTRYASITYDTPAQLSKFYDTFGQLDFPLSSSGNQSLTIQEDIKKKVESLVENIEMILEMFPEKLGVKIILLNSATEVQDIYRSLYGQKVSFVAFYSPRDHTIYISVADIKLKVLAHEMAHAVIDQYFVVGPAVKIHELLANYAERQILIKK